MTDVKLSDAGSAELITSPIFRDLFIVTPSRTGLRFPKSSGPLVISGVGEADIDPGSSDDCADCPCDGDDNELSMSLEELSETDGPHMFLPKRRIAVTMIATVTSIMMPV